MPVLLVEPPGPFVPARAGLTISAIDWLRIAAATAALVLALASRGDALVLAGLLAVAAWRPLATAGVVPALVAASWRWGSTSLEALAGAQAVLGPAGLVGPGRAAATSWLAAAAILLVVAWPLTAGRRAGEDRSARPVPPPSPERARLLLVAAASGASVAAVVAGPAPGGAVWARAATAIFGTALAVGVALVRSRGGRLPAALDVAAVLAGLAALFVLSSDAPAWSGTVDGSAVRAGALTAVAVGMLAVVGGRAAGAMGQRHP